LLYFSTYRLSSFSDFSICQQTSECPMQRTMLAAVRAFDERLIASRHFKFLPTYHFLTSNVCCSRCKTHVAVYLLHSRVNLICI